MKTLRRFSAVLIGIVFFVSGILKFMDPVGTSLIVEAYLNFFKLGFLRPVSYFCGVAFAVAETATGAALITGVWRRITAFASLVLTSFFTLVTLVLLIANPDMDCGCFGEAVHLTHAQSFIKNLVILALWALAYIPFRTVGEPAKVKYASFAIVMVSSLLFFLYSALSIPLVDFTEYKPGNELTSMEDFDFSSGEEPLLLNFRDAADGYADSLALEGKVMVVSVSSPDRLSEKKWRKVSSFVRTAEEAGFTSLVLVASTPELFGGIVQDPFVLSHSYFADRKKLVTLNRSNAGVVFIDDAYIVSKWSFNHAPDRETLMEIASLDQAEVVMSSSGKSALKFQAFMLYVFAVMLLI